MIAPGNVREAFSGYVDRMGDDLPFLISKCRASSNTCALRLCSGNPCLCPLSYELAFELGHGRKKMKYQQATGRSGVDIFGYGLKVDPPFAESFNDPYEVLN